MHRPFLSRTFALTLLGSVLAIAACYPFSPAVRQRHKMATMQLFADQLQAEWAAAGKDKIAALRLDVITSVQLAIRIDQSVDDATWNDLLSRVRAKRDSYLRLSPIRVIAGDGVLDTHRAEWFVGK